MRRARGLGLPVQNDCLLPCRCAARAASALTKTAVWGSARRLLLFLGSMRVAVMLLLAVAVASVSGTILQQNQPDVDYLVKFGPFWHEVYRTLGLFDVYSSLWFILMLAFMMGSTGLCIVRHAPVVWRQMRDFRDNLPEAAIRRRRHVREFLAPTELEPVREGLIVLLRGQGWRLRLDRCRLSAMKGRLNRLSYLLVHAAVLIICVGGLLDSNAGLKWRIMRGELELEQRELPAAEVPSRSRLGSDNPAFRSSVLIAEGKASNFSFINIGSGYLLQSLPFVIQLVDFRVEHYPSGQPKSFESDLLIRDAAGAGAQAHTIKVNHPLKHRGYTIYQSSFADGGSVLQLAAHPLSASAAWDDEGDGQSGSSGPLPASAAWDDGGDRQSAASGSSPASADPALSLRGALGAELSLSAVVGESLPLLTAAGRQQLELTEFRRFNVFAEQDGGFSDRGPSMSYVLRNEDGSALEFENYMRPVRIDERYYMLSGVRSSARDPFKFLYLPMDDDFSLRRFFQFHKAVHDDALLAELASQLARDSDLQSQDGIDPADAIARFAMAFRERGFNSISDFVQGRMAPQDRPDALRHYTSLLQTLLAAVYRRTFPQASLSPRAGEDVAERSTDETFFQDAVIALSSLPEYGAPVFFALRDFEHREASGLQINRAPGAVWVYLGFLFLVGGVFLMFYVSHQRLFILLKEEPGGTRVLIAGERTRRRGPAFAEEFAVLCQDISRSADWQALDLSQSKR